MGFKLPPLSSVRVFEAAARHGSFKKAARGHAYRHERALKPANGSWIDAKSPRYVNEGFAISEPLESFLTLVGIHLARASKTHPAGLRLCGLSALPVENSRN
jgi:hypothetical protein